MRITFDPDKDAANRIKHGIAFDEIYDFDFSKSYTIVDARRDYGETRYRATGFLHGRLYMLVYVETSDGIRAISFRKANLRESKRYEKETQ